MAAEEGTATAVGTLLNGTYLLERVIAEGGMGVVYEAAHVRLPRRFAVKILGKPGDPRVSATSLQRFRREAEIASTLAHPHIVEVFDYQISESGSPYLVMELLEGEDLADRLKRTGRMPMVAALRIIEEISQALDVAHGAGVVHRDLKPANIFLSKRAGREDFVKVLDFGVSKIIDAATLTHEKAMVGTPLYMSPEQAVGTQELSPASDVFSLGSIAYEMLSGRRAFAASNIPSILYQIVHGPTPSLSGRTPGIGPSVDEVFSRVLAKKREERFQRAGDFAQALSRAIDRQSGQMPVIKLPASPALDGHWPEEPSSPALYSEPPPPSDLFKTGAAGETDVDPSTKAEEAMDALAEGLEPEPPPAPASRSAESLPSEIYRIERKRRWPWLVGAALVIPGALGLAVVLQRSKNEPPVAVVAPPAARLVSSEPPVKPTTRLPPQVTIPAAPPPAAPTPNEQPAHKPTVQFTFHVVPKNAEIRVDDRRIRGGRITLPWKDVARRVRVSAPGYEPLSLSAPSTESRVFELRMDRLQPVKRPAPRPPKPSHDAAPVQDL